MKSNYLLALGALAAPIFIVTFLIQGFMRAQYSWLKHPVSSLSIGPQGWIQITNFIITGSLVILFAIGLRLSLEPHSRGSLWGPIAVAIAGIGLIGAGLCVSDPVFGYPPDRPLILRQFTLIGHLHDFFSMFWFVGLPTACFVFVRRFFAVNDAGWAMYSLLCGIGMLVFFVLAAIGFSQTKGFVDHAGIFQRLAIGTGLLWLTLTAFHQMRRSQPG